MRLAAIAIAAFALSLGFSFSQANLSQEITSKNVKSITPVLLVKEIEPLIPFWVDRLGFTKTIEVPEGNKLGFVAFQKGAAEVMYQTYSSVEKRRAFLYVRRSGERSHIPLPGGGQY